MKKVLFVMAILAIFALPALAQYQGSVDPDRVYWTYQYYTGFESGYVPGHLDGQQGWIKPANGTATNISVDIANDPGKAIAGTKYAINGPTTSTQGAIAAKTMYGAGGTNVHKEGFVEFWMYDPRGTGTGVETDTRAWVFSPAYVPSSTTTSSSFTWGATLGDTRPGGKNYWVFAMGGSFFAADGSGTTAAGGAGGGLVFTSVAGAARPRTLGWHQVQLYWNFSDTQGRLEMYVDDMITPCITADFSSINSRWANMKNVAGIWLGNTSGATTKPGIIDDISFYSTTAVPEPSSLLALGAGAMGLLGLIRRRK